MRMRALAAVSLLLVAACAAVAAEPAATASALPPKRIHYTAPLFPAEALKQHIGGVVTVHFTIDVRGSVRNPQVVGSYPPRVFDAAALEAVMSWRYEPTRVDGRLVEVPITIAIRFPLTLGTVPPPARLGTPGLPPSNASFEDLIKHLREGLAKDP